MDAGRAETVALLRRLLAEWSEGTPADWENVTVPQWLDALAAWLDDCDGLYPNLGQPVPSDPWQIVRDAVQAARIYE